MLLGTGWLARVLPGDADDLADDLLALLVTATRTSRGWCASTATPTAEDRPMWGALRRAPRRRCDEARGARGRFRGRLTARRTLVDRAPVGIGFSDGGLRLGYVNDHLARVLGAPVAVLLGTGWLARVLPGDADDLADDLLALLVDGEDVARLVRVHGTDGEAVVQVRATAVPQAAGGRGFLLTAEDVTEQQVRERRLAFEARHDALTGLGNRTALQERLAAVLADPRRRRGCAVAMLDLDGFKELNDRLGHDRGDQVLVAVATAVSRAVRDDDLVVRLGGDELVVVGEGVVDGGAGGPDVAAEDGRPALEELAERLVRAVQDAAGVAVPSARVTACLGLVAVGDRRDADVVLRDADLAMYAAKAAGAGRWVVRPPGAAPGVPRPSPPQPDA